MTEREIMLAGHLYDPFDPELVSARARARDLCQALNATREAKQDERRRILQECSAPVAIPYGCSRLSSATTVRT